MPLYYPAQGGRGSISSNTNYPPQSIKSVIIPFPNGWDYRAVLTTKATEVTGSTHTDYPLYVSIQDDLIKTVTQPFGQDILFTTTSDVTIPFLIEVFDRSAGIIKAWLKKTINNSTDVLTRLYIGNNDASDAQDGINVWDSNFKAVYLMNEGTLAANGLLLDRTASPSLTTVVGTTGLQSSTGLVGRQEQMGSTSFSYATIASSTKLNVITGLTVEYIANKKTSSPNASPMIFNKGAAVNTQHTTYWTGGVTPAINIKFVGAVVVPFSTGFSPTLNQNHYVAHTYDGANVKGIVDAVKKQETAETRNIDVSTSVSQIGISGTILPWGPSNSIDLIRLSDIARSEDFITTSNNNFFNPTVFTTQGDFLTASEVP